MIDLRTEVRPDRNLAVVLSCGDPPVPAPQAGTVRWYVQYTAVHPLTVASTPKDAVWIDVSAHPHAYWAALRDIWAQGETFALIEHDIVCRPDAVEAFEACREPWCVFKRDDFCHPECQEAWANQLSLTRLRAEIIEAVPDALSSIPDAGRDWHNLCDRLGDRLRDAGFTHHWHAPEVHHHRMGRP